MLQDASVRLVMSGCRPLVRWALSHLSESAPDLVAVGETVDAITALHAVDTLAPDVVLVDCSYEDGSGWSLARELRARQPDLGIVVLTDVASDDLLFKTLDSGASAYVSMQAEMRDVIAAIRHAALSPHGFTAAGLAEALRRRREPLAVTASLVLSAREKQVLQLLQDGLSVPAVAATLYVSVSTAKTYVARLYGKLGANNRAQALMAAVRLGLTASDRPTDAPAC